MSNGFGKYSKPFHKINLGNYFDSPVAAPDYLSKDSSNESII